MPFSLLSSLRTVATSAAFLKSAAVDGSKPMKGARNASPVANSVPSPAERLVALLRTPPVISAELAAPQARNVLPYLDMEGNEV